MQYVVCQRQLEQLAEERRPVLLLQCMFTAWVCVVREERRELWELEHRARRCHER